MADEDAFEGLSAEEIATLASVEDLLGEPSVWADPPAAMEAAVLASIAAEPPRGAVPSPAVERRRVVRGVGMALIGATAALFVVVGALGYRGPQRGGGPTTEVALATGGSVKINKFGSGWRVGLDTTLPRVDGPRHYQASLLADNGIRVPLGTFNEGRDVVLWSGVPPRQLRTFVITVEPEGREILRARFPG